MAPITIEGHLIDFIAEGELDIHKLLPEEKMQRLLSLLEKKDASTTLTAIK